MARTIREEIVGRVLIHTDDGPLWLTAGDTVPAKVHVSEQLLTPEEPVMPRSTAKRGGRRAASK